MTRDERLRELEEAYRPLAIPSPFWTSHSRTMDFDRFRAHWQYLDTKNYGACREVVEHLRRRGHEARITALGEDGAFGCETTEVDGLTVSRDLLDSIVEIAFLEGALPAGFLDRARVLDIGAGYGRLAHRLTAAFPEAFVYCTDAIPVSTVICEEYVRFRGLDRVRVVPLHELAEIGAVDLAVNIHSWSECTPEGVRFWLDFLEQRAIPRVFIVPHTPNLATCSPTSPDSGPSYRPDLEARGYRQVAYWYGPEAKPKAYYLFEKGGA